MCGIDNVGESAIGSDSYTKRLIPHWNHGYQAIVEGINDRNAVRLAVRDVDVALSCCHGTSQSY
jgi:hypothetical protein